jgi:hypothetical protein
LASHAPRDHRIDALRGLSLLMIFTNHLGYLGGNQVLRNGSLAALTLCDCANVFVFVSGLMAGHVYGRRLDAWGARVVRRRVFARAFQLYRWHLGTLAVALALVVVLHSAGMDPLPRSRLAPLFARPLAGLSAVVTMAYAPYAFDVLRLYILFLLVLPFWLPLLERRPRLALGLSVAAYLVPQIWPGVAIPDWPGGRVWYFNPLAWQLQFFLGAAIARRGLPGPAGFWRSSGLTAAAGAVVIAGVLVRTAAPALMAAHDPAVPFIHDDLVYGSLPLTGKTNLEPVRLLYFLALALLTTRLLPAAWRGWRSRWLRPLAICGRRGLQTYCLGLVLVYATATVFNRLGGGDLGMIAATWGGIAVQFAVTGRIAGSGVLNEHVSVTRAEQRRRIREAMR